MRLHKLTLVNFRNVEYAELDLSHSTFLLGNNGAGKSTIHNALQLALHGWCEHTTKAGAGFQDLIRDGQKSANIELDFSDGDATLRVALTLGKTRDWSLIDTPTGEILEHVSSPAALWPHLGINQTHAAVCMFPTQIVNAPEFSAILSDFLSAALTPEALDARIPAEHRDGVTAIAATHHIRLDAVAGYESLGTVARDQRTVLNRDLKLVKAVLADMPFLRPVTDPQSGARLGIESMPVLTQEHADIAASLRTLYQQRGAAEAQPVAVALPDIDALETEHKHLASLHYSATVYEGLVFAANQAQAEMTAANQAQANAVTMMTAAEADAPTHCPTCGGKLTKAKREALVADAVAAAGLARSEAEERQKAALRANSAARAALEAATAPAESAPELTVKLTDSRIALETARRVVASQPAPYSGPALADIIAQIEASEARQSTITALLGELTTHKQKHDAEAELAALTSRHDLLDWLVKQYYDGVAYRGLLAAAAAPIVETVNSRIAGTLAIEPAGKSFALTWNGRPLARASRGQRATVAYAMAEAFAQCGAPVLLDDTNDLDPYARGALCMRLRGAATGSVVLAGTPNSVEPDYPTRIAGLLAPMQIVVVEDGQYRVAGATPGEVAA